MSREIRQTVGLNTFSQHASWCFQETDFQYT